MNIKKATSKLVIKGPLAKDDGKIRMEDKGYYFSYRAPCPVDQRDKWKNGNTWSMPGADVDNDREKLKDVISEAEEKYGLLTVESDWQLLVTITNTRENINNGEAEIIYVWLHEQPVDVLKVVPEFSAGLVCLPVAEFYGTFKDNLSPGLKPLFLKEERANLHGDESSFMQIFHV